MAKVDKASTIKVSNALNTATISTNATTAGVAIDMSGYESLTLVFEVGARTDGTYTPLVTESDDNITYTTVPSTFLIGALTAITAANTNVKVGYVGKSQYVKASVVSTAVTTGATVGVKALQTDALSRPVA
jgi:hypothetical protein